MKISKVIAGKEVILESGKFAHLADGAVTVTVGETVLLVTAVMSREAKEGIDFFPLTVEYQEKFYATGKIKGSRFIKREGRPSDSAVLAGRVIDRSIRPMFVDGLRNDVQVIISVLSCDMENDPDILGVLGASAAVRIAGVPFETSVVGVRIGRIDGKFIVNPTYTELEAGDLDLLVCGTADSITMIEAGAKEVDENVILEAIGVAHAEIKNMCALQDEFVNMHEKKTFDVSFYSIPDEVFNEVFASVSEEDIKALYGLSKDPYNKQFAIIKDKVLEKFQPKIEDESMESWTKPLVLDALKKTVKKHMRKNLVEKNLRLDGRDPKQIRPLSSEISVLPRTHGSGLFQRGDTQALTVTTLGAPGDSQVIEEMDQDFEKRYMHHYNFPPFSTGETGRVGSPGRREIGHGYLAERALEPVLPSKEDFPYTMRLVSEILASNGSSSMAATCGSTLSLMDAGVPITAPVSGIAMGVIVDHDTGKYTVLSDIQGEEDFLGDMDFKVAGTAKGVTAMQLDMKVKGLNMQVLIDAVTQAKAGRAEILANMLSAISTPKTTLSKYAPLLIKIVIDPDKIREVIGKGGETIQKITKECDVSIDIDDIGLVIITAPNQEAGDKARAWVERIVYVPKAGDIFEGAVKRVESYGIFVEVTPSKDGLVHISKISSERTSPEDLQKMFKVGDMVKVKLAEIDEEGRYNLHLVK